VSVTTGANVNNIFFFNTDDGGQKARVFVTNICLICTLAYLTSLSMWFKNFLTVTAGAIVSNLFFIDTDNGGRK
jgi:hypothetical protein